MLTGFGRSFDIHLNYIGIGYFLLNNPYGKYMRYREGHLFAQGIWRANSIQRVREVLDLRENEEPEGGR